MSTTRVVRYTSEDPNPQQLTPTFSQTDTGATWSKLENGIGGYFYRARITNSTPSLATKTAKWTFSGSQDFRKIDPIYGISANRCIVRYRARLSTSESNIWPTAGPQYYNSLARAHFTNTYGGSFGNPIFGFNEYYQTGSDITTTTPNLLQPGALELTFRATNFRTDNINGQFVVDIEFNDVAIRPSVTAGLTYSWEANDHTIDGLNGDTAPIIQADFNLSASSTLIKYISANPTIDCNLIEQSQSVITGVEKTLQSNFALLAAARVEHFATKTLRQETELLGTTFNFRFMESLTVSAEHTSLISGNVIRGLFSSLSLTNNVTANFVGNMIYDIAVEYTWDDFGIMGYFVTGYTVRGYSVEQSEYTWQELVDPWDSWTYSTWQGNETGWDQWPEDIWNSTKRLSFNFDFAQVGQIIRGAVSQLMSTTALTENAAYRIEGVPGEIRSDFLCDGSPSGLIGGSSTIISDAVLTALGNYIIDNAQNITGAFDATLLANYIVQFLWQAQSDFSLAVTPTFKPGGVTNAQCITMVDALGNAIYGPSKTLQGAFDPEFIARMFFTTDPYQIYKVLQETRQIFVDAESRGIEIPEEIRLNSIPAELRDWLVPQETRNMKLRIPPMTNRFTTPKIRRE